MDNISHTILKNLDVNAVRKSFPILNREVKGKPLVYFDNAATTQKPLPVIEALTDYYSKYNANIHRGIHSLAEEATAAFEASRDKVKQFINASSRDEIIFTSGTTESINLVAQTWGRQNLQPGDEIILSEMEHHSNIVPWYMIAKEKNAIIKTIPINEKGELKYDVFEKLIGKKTKIVSIVHVSNAMGTINDVERIIDLAHQNGAVVMVDGAQSAVHLDIDVQKLNCDFFAFSAHKVYGPTGTGVLYGKEELLNEMPPYKGGGEMIKEVSFNEVSWNDLPYKFEAGTPNIADVIAFKAALDFVDETGKQLIRDHENKLLQYATENLLKMKGLSIIGNNENKISVISFVIEKIHAQDIGILLDNKGVALRTGHHCAQPLMQCFGVSGTSRISFAMYNTFQEIDVLIDGLNRAIKVLS